MKKLSLWCMAGLVAIMLYLISIPASVKAAELPKETPAQETFSTEEGVRPSLSTVRLKEQDKEILDEVLCDYVSEEVVRLMDAQISYKIGDWLDKGTHTYLFLEKDLSEGTVYTACGYTETSNGSYVYFELSSLEPLTQETVDAEIRAYSNMP